MASVECSKENEECTRRVFEAVNNNSASSFKSARDTYSEIQFLTSLAERNEEGETPLAIAIKRNYVYVVKEIVSFLKNVLDSNIDENLRKLIFSIDQILRGIPIKELIDILIHDLARFQQSVKWLFFVAKTFSKCISCTRQDKIILLEVIGTALITQLRHVKCTHEAEFCGNYGLECWREAMTLRYFPTDGGDPIPKLPDVHVPSVLSSVIFGSAVEVATIEELDLLQQDFKLNHLNLFEFHIRISYEFHMRTPCAKRMQIQALLVMRRISAQEHLGHPHWLYLKSLLDFADVWGSDENIGIKPYLFILEELNGFDPNLLPLASFYVLYRTLDLLSDKFRDNLREPPNSPRGREVNYANLLMITKLITTIEGNHPHFQNWVPHLFEGIQWRVSSVVYRLVFVLDSISSRITSEEQQTLEKFYYDYFRADFPERTTTVLHDAVYYCDCTSKNHARLQTIKRLLQFGADPNAIDEDGQTPLHCLAEWTQFSEMDESVPFFQVLLDAGAHLDTVADDGKTVLCILKKMLEGKVHPYFESLINCVLPLSCYCARVIRRHGIPFEDRLPPRLKKLVSSHSPKASIDLERKGVEEHAHKKRKI